jgi:putative DNA primase/helicase
MKADHSTISNMTRAVVSETLITDKNMPCWINGAEGRPYRDLVVFSNGILDISQYLAGSEDALLDLTPDLFTTAALPVSYDPTAKCPQWQAFLESSLGDDPQKIALLQEWMGYCITTDMSMQKMMFLRGVKRSGKGTIIRAMISLIGDGQSVTTDYLALTGAHAMYPLMGKLGCFLPDAEAQGTNIPHGLGVLLKITGCDAVQINQKNRDQIASYKLMCRITIASNEFPNFPDHAGAMEARLNIIDFQRSFAGREDYHLDDKLKSELSGIAVWALEGLRRLRAQERFTVPPSSVSALEAFRLNASPTASFVYELTDPTPGGWVLKSELADVWEQWSRGMGLKDVSRQRLMERIRMTAPYITEEVDEARGVGYSVVKGVTWKPWVHKKFLGRP